MYTLIIKLLKAVILVLVPKQINLYLLYASFHWGLDTGLCKLVPKLMSQVMDF